MADVWELNHNSHNQSHKPHTEFLEPPLVIGMLAKKLHVNWKWHEQRLGDRRGQPRPKMANSWKSWQPCNARLPPTWSKWLQRTKKSIAWRICAWCVMPRLQRLASASPRQPGLKQVGFGKRRLWLGCRTGRQRCSAVSMQHCLRTATFMLTLHLARRRRVSCRCCSQALAGPGNLL